MECCIYTRTYIYLNTSTRIHIYMYAYTYIYIYLYISGSDYGVCITKCAKKHPHRTHNIFLNNTVYVFVYIYVYIYIYIHIYIYVHIYICVFIYVYTHIFTYIYQVLRQYGVRITKSEKKLCQTPKEPFLATYHYLLLEFSNF